LAKKALKMLFKFGFDDLNLHLIWGETFDGNPACALFERIGMEKEGTRRDFYFKEGKFISCHLYSITSDQFDQKPVELKIEQ
jgi:RimJ/RimL family protein N-acetyltransferase